MALAYGRLAGLCCGYTGIVMLLALEYLCKKCIKHRCVVDSTLESTQCCYTRARTKTRTLVVVGSINKQEHAVQNGGGGGV